MTAIRFFPSLMAANQLALGSVITALEPVANGFHIDVMDGHFAPNLAFGTPTINAITKATDKPLHVHLMVQHPELVLPLLHLRKNDLVLVHYEVLAMHHSTTDYLKIGIMPHTKAQVGLVINPDTPAATIPDTLLELVPHVLVMAVRPGFSGQAFMPIALDQARILIQRAREKNYQYVIGMDGGINATTAPQAVAAGATELALASALFDTPDPVAALQQLKG